MWWLTLDRGWHWTREERLTRGAIWLVSCALFLPSYLIVVSIVEGLGVGERVAAVIGAFSCLPPAMWLGRMTAVRGWPDMVRKADESAAERLVKEKSRRS